MMTTAENVMVASFLWTTQPAQKGNPRIYYSPGHCAVNSSLSSHLHSKSLGLDILIPR